MELCVTPTNADLILVAEDDPPQRFLLQSWLRQEGFRVQLCANGDEARTFLEHQWVNLALIDWDMPGMDGEALLRWIRRRTQTQLPVIFQSVHSEGEDLARMLDAGADDFLSKPLERCVLISRVKAVLRRYRGQSGDNKLLQLGGVMLDATTLRLCTAEHCVSLGSKEFAIAWHLAQHAGAVVLRQELLKVGWGLHAEVETRTIDMYVSRLRARLKDGAVPWHIQPVYGRGYRLVLGDGQATENSETDGLNG
jgi:two-component system phosphate regulon response regulator PhoB